MLWRFSGRRRGMLYSSAQRPIGNCNKLQSDRAQATKKAPESALFFIVS
jgi:hypothetical protein